MISRQVDEYRIRLQWQAGFWFGVMAGFLSGILVVAAAGFYLS